MTDDADIEEQEWLYAAARNPAFDFLNDQSLPLRSMILRER